MGGDQVAGGQRSQRPGAPGHQHAAIAVQRPGDGQRRTCRLARPGSSTATPPAPGARQTPSAATPTAHRSRTAHPAQPGSARSAPAPGSIQVKRLIRHPRALRRHRSRVADVGLAHLHKPATPAPAAAARHPQTPRAGNPAPHPHPARGLRGGRLSRTQIAGGGDVRRIQTGGGQHLPLARTGGRVHLRAEVAGDLHRGHAHPARGGVDQHRLPGPQPRQIHQRVIGRRKRHRHRRRLSERPPRPGRSPTAGDRSPPPGRTHPA